MTAIGLPHPAPRRGLATRLLLAQAVVLIAGTVTAGVVALVVGPPLFHQHLLEAGHSEGSAELSHIEQAYRDASAISLGIALLTALVAALAVIFFLTRRIRAALAALTSAAAAVSRGRYDVRVPASDAGAEFDALSTAFNEMAGRLDAVEDTRRRLLSDLAHEMRTPIATLSAYLEGADDGVVEWGTATSQVLREQTDRLAKLAGDIDDVSRAQEGRVVLQRKPELVGDLVWAAAEAARAAFTRKGVNLLADPSGAPGATVLVDRQRMAQVLDNLLGNALRHAPPGGVVRIGCQLHEKSVQLVVSDNGDGIAAEPLRHVFERFYRADSARDRAHGGSGIGLTISKALVEAHGGIIDAHSAGLGLGATFTVTLPSTNDRVFQPR